MTKQDTIEQLQGLGYEVDNQITNSKLEDLLIDLDNTCAIRVYWGCMTWVS